MLLCCSLRGFEFGDLGLVFWWFGVACPVCLCGGWVWGVTVVGFSSSVVFWVLCGFRFLVGFGGVCYLLLGVVVLCRLVWRLRDGLRWVCWIGF